MVKLLAAQEIEDFQRFGVVCLRKVLPDIWIEKLRVGVAKNLASPSIYACQYTKEGQPGSFRDDYCNWRRIDEYKEFIWWPKLGLIVSELMETEYVQFFHEHVFVKEKFTQERTPWHHDYTYYPLSGSKGLSLWIALDNVEISDSVDFIEGSHLWANMFRPRKFASADYYEGSQGFADDLPDIDANLASYPLKSWAVEAGDVIAFHMKTVHGQSIHKNQTSANRRTFVTRWLGDDIVFAKRAWQTSPPFPNLTLLPGDKLPLDHFPIVWTRNCWGGNGYFESQ